jgi:SAM-dependent methyltransferase
MKQPPLLRRLLCEQETLRLEVDAPERMAAHRAVLERKPMIQNVFREFHQACMGLDASYFGDTPGLRIEIGAGVSPMRASYPDVLATDVVATADLDRLIDAQDMDLADGSVRAVYGQNCFHHLPDPSEVLSELQRVVAPGGGAILIEPYYGPVARVLYRHLFASEGFDMNAPEWTTELDGPMHGANQALSYIVFKRDRARFARAFPQLRLVHNRPCPTTCAIFSRGAGLPTSGSSGTR